MSGAAIAAGVMAASRPPPPPVPPLAAHTSPNPVTGYYHNSEGIGYTDYTACVVTSGVPPYLFLWQYLSGFNYSTTDPNSANIQFVFYTTAPLSARYTVDVYDANAQHVTTFVDVQTSGSSPGVTPPPSGGGIAPTVTVTPSVITSHKPGGGTATFTFNSTVTGGVPPFTYLWSEGTSSVTNPSTTFSEHAPASDSNDGTVTLQVTGADGGVGYGHGDWHALGF